VNEGTLDRNTVLFVSHRLTDSGQPDRYFGEIPAAFESFVLLINHRPLWRQVLCRARDEPGTMTIPPGLGVLTEVHLVWEAFVTAVRLWRSPRAATGSADGSIWEEAVMRSSDATTALRIAHAVRLACAVFRPDVLIVTYEGHPWEKLAFHAARSTVPGCVMFGYLHAGLLPNTHSALRELGRVWDPDGLLVPGVAARREIERTLPMMPVEVLGSARRLNIPPSERHPSPLCLVLSEGFMSETELLTDFALQTAKLAPHVTFLLHLHPLVRGRPSFRRLDENILESPNVHVSVSSLREDASRARWCLYRGSTAAVMAVASGVEPLYLHKDGEPVIDPLAQSEQMQVSEQHVIRDPTEAASRMLLGSDLSQFVEQSARDYFMPIDVGAVQRLRDRCTLDNESPE
jgi:hypothetical protein